MVNNSKLCGMIGIATKAGKVVAGTDACLEDIKNGNVRLVLIAKDASDRSKNAFKREAQKYHIESYEVLSIEELSKSMGKVNKAVIGIKDNGFAKKMISIINGGEVIG